MLHGFPKEFGFRVGSHEGTRPNTTDFGTLLTSGAADTYGSYAEVLSDTLVTQDCFGIQIYINSNNLASNARDGTITIGKDETGGTSYTDWLTDLICGEACDGAHGPGVWYYFPMYIKAGTALAAKFACSTGTQTCSIALTLFGRPSIPVWAATKFQSFGASAGNGTAITAGTTSEGSWTAMGSNPSFPLKYIQWGWQSGDTTMADIIYHIDIGKGDASNKLVILEEQVVRHDVSERISKTCWGMFDSQCDVTTADLLYMRAQCSGTSDATLQAAIYGVG